MATMCWRETDVAGAVQNGDPLSCAAGRVWQEACTALCVPKGEEAWSQIVQSSPPDGIWHSLRNCVAYQAGFWQNLLAKGIPDVMQPAAFKMAIVLRHTPQDLVVKILGDMLKSHPQCQDLTSYVLALLTDDELSGCGPQTPPSSPGLTQPGPTPLRDLQLYGDCELAVMASSVEEYDTHARLVREEYAQLSERSYSELRIKVLNQFTQIPKLFHSPEFEGMENTARGHIEREIHTLRGVLVKKQ